MADDLIPYREGMDYGIGLDTPSGDTRNVAVAGLPTSIPNAGGSIVDFELTQISTDEDLQTAMGISVSASGGVGLFSASASMDFAKNTHVQSSSVFLLVSVRVNLAFSQVKEPKLLPEAGAKLGDGSSTRFQEMYGDSFVRGMQTGGRFFAVVEIFTSSRSEHESLSASIKGSYGLFSAKGSFSSEFTDAVSSRSLKIRVHREGGVVPKDPTSLDEVQAIASGFAASVDGHAVPYAVVLDRYSILDLPNPPNYIDLQNQLEVLAYCAKQRNMIWTALNDVDYILEHPQQFTLKPGADQLAPLVAYRAALEVDLMSVMKAASYALDHPKETKLPTIAAVRPDMPERLESEADDLAARGEQLLAADALAVAIRDHQPSPAGQRGFAIGMATMSGNTLWGPGAKSIQDSLDPQARAGFAVAAAYCLGLNNNLDVAGRGASVLKADPKAAVARDSLPAGVSWLGFEIASGIFGGAALGGMGNTLLGPGSKKIKLSLDSDGQRGFDAAVAYFKPGGQW